MKRLFIKESRLIRLQESIRFLDHYMPDGNEHVVGESLDKKDENKSKTECLRRLGQLNLDRKQLIESLTKIQSET